MAFMRHNNNGRRHNNNRHRHQGNGNNQQQGQRRHVNRINHVFESNGPDGRVRGTAQQIVEKYMTMARDAQSSGDKVLSINYYQHAEHYQRVLNDIQEENAVFERERDAQRAAQQAERHDAASDDADGAVEHASDMVASENDDAQNQEQRQQRPARAPQQQRERAPRRKNDDDQDDLNTLPGFLQVPITEAAPPVASAVAKPEKAKTEPKKVEVEMAKPRVVRTRRVAPAAASAENTEAAE